MIKHLTQLILSGAATLLMFPLLLIQALWLRANLIKLPEPKGERNGNRGNGQLIKLLILGDSAAAGVGVNQQTDALSGQLSAQLAKQYQVNWQLIATSGFTSAQMIETVNAMSSQSFDFVLLSVGVNDVTHLTAKNAWQNNLTTLLNLLMAKFSCRILVTSIPPMHLFLGLPQPLRCWLGARAKRFNRVMATVVNHCQKSSLLELTVNVLPENLAEDGIHPSKITYQQWAKQAAEAIGRLSHNNRVNT